MSLHEELFENVDEVLQADEIIVIQILGVGMEDMSKVNHMHVDPFFVGVGPGAADQVPQEKPVVLSLCLKVLVVVVDEGMCSADIVEHGVPILDRRRSRRGRAGT